MAQTKIHAKKLNNAWYWYNEAKGEYISPINPSDKLFKALNPKIQFEILQSKDKAAPNKNQTNQKSPILEKYKKLNSFLKSEITGQDHVIDQWTKILSSNEFNNWNQPNIGLFLGPTGTGKTYLAKKTNEFLNGDDSNFLRIDCNSPRYQDINYNKQNLEEIADFVKNHPNGIILLDEFEKLLLTNNNAFFTSFLNIFDDGYIQDRDGRKHSCGQNTFVMTSNVGAQYLLMNDKMSMKQILQQIFPPEFLGRIDKSIFYFNVLKFKDLMKAAKLSLNADDGLITKQLGSHRIQIKLDDESIKNIVLASCGVLHNLDDLVSDGSAFFNQPYSEETKNLIATHESGHAIVALAQMNQKEKKTGNYPVKKITAIASGGAGGYTLSWENEQEIPNKEKLIEECVELYGGRAAEDLYCGANSTSTGWSNDKHRINQIIGTILLNFNPTFSQYITEDAMTMQDIISSFDDDDREIWKKEFKKLENEIKTRCEKILKDHKTELELFVKGQKIKGSLDSKEIKYIWDNKKLPQTVTDVAKKSKEEQEIIKIDNGANELVSSTAGVRAIKNWTKNNLAYQFQELYETGKIQDDSEVELIVDEDGKLLIKGEAKEQKQTPIKKSRGGR